jgi:hypothetical protein
MSSTTRNFEFSFLNSFHRQIIFGLRVLSSHHFLRFILSFNSFSSSSHSIVVIVRYPPTRHLRFFSFSSPLFQRRNQTIFPCCCVFFKIFLFNLLLTDCFHFSNKFFYQTCVCVCLTKKEIQYLIFFRQGNFVIFLTFFLPLVSSFSNYLYHS